MTKYVRLMRLPDQYLQLFGAISAGIFLHTRAWYIVWWALAVTLLSIAAFMLNEVIDKEDTDKYSWNKIHVRRGEQFNMRIVAAMFISLSVAGMIMSWLLGYFWWGFAIWAIAVSYSIEPFRLKRRFGLDLAAQGLACLILPFLAPTWAHVNGDFIAAFLIVSTLAFLSGILPYQLADFVADIKAKIQGFHIVLGMDRSLIFGLGLGTLSFLLYFVFDLFRWEPWTIPAAFIFPVILVFYLVWIRNPTFTGKVTMIQNSVRIIKPISRLLVLYLLVVWRFF